MNSLYRIASFFVGLIALMWVAYSICLMVYAVSWKGILGVEYPSVEVIANLISALVLLKAVRLSPARFVRRKFIMIWTFPTMALGVLSAGLKVVEVLQAPNVEVVRMCLLCIWLAVFVLVSSFHLSLCSDVPSYSLERKESAEWGQQYQSAHYTTEF